MEKSSDGAARGGGGWEGGGRVGSCAVRLTESRLNMYFWRDENDVSETCMSPCSTTVLYTCYVREMHICPLVGRTLYV